MACINGSAGHVPVGRMSLVTAALIAALSIPLCASTALAAGSVSGQITRSDTHAGIGGARVQFWDLNANNDGPVATATADGNGNYSQNLPDGSYALVTQNSQGYINKIWNNIPCSAVCDTNSFTAVMVAGVAITGFNFALDPGGAQISGTITSSAPGNPPIAGALVFFLGLNADIPFATATTDSSGNYTSDGGSVTGSVLVFTANGQGFQDEAYNNHKCSIDACDTDTVDPVPRRSAR